MTIPRATGFCFHYIDKIYVCGGFSKDEKRSKKIEVFDLISNSWSLLKVNNLRNLDKIASWNLTGFYH